MVSDVTIQTAIDQQSQTSAAGSSLATDFADFLNLLTVQLQNQDPLSPMDSTEFTNQLVQFTAVEQQINTNQKLDSLVALQLSNSMSSAQSYVGNDISYISSEFFFDGSPSAIRYSMPSAASEATLRVYNEDGGLVYEEQVSGQPGAHEFSWDGRLLGGGVAPDGTYEVEIDAIDDSGKAVQATTVVTGTVTGVESQNGQIFLISGERAVALSNVINTSVSNNKADNTTALTSALEYIGLDVTYNNDKMILKNDESVTVDYTLPSKADQAKILIYNDVGKLVATDNLPTSAGPNSYTWDGDGLPAGEYTYKIDAVVQKQTVVKETTMNYNGTDELSVNYTLSAAADSIQVKIRDASGNVVHTTTADRDSGTNTYTWQPAGNIPEGDYTIEIVNVDDEDTKINVPSTTAERVTGVESDNGVIFLQIGPSRTIPLSEILGVKVPEETAGA
jgi:flagellar basal-body rod modification protein FlgD